MENNQGNKLGKGIKALYLKFKLFQDEFAKKANIPYTNHTNLTKVVKLAL